MNSVSLNLRLPLFDDAESAEEPAKGDPCTPQGSPVDLVSWVVGWAKETDSKK